MRDGDDVASGMCLDQPVNCLGHPFDDGDETLAARWGLVGGGVPKAMEIAGTGLL